MAITGQSLAVVERYIRDFNRVKLAKLAMASIEDDANESELKTNIG
jgi:hypothetical protein